MAAKFNAVVLAGGVNNAEMQQETGVTVRALVPLGDHTMLDWTLKALYESKLFEQIVVVGDVPVSSGYRTVKPTDTIVDNLLTGITEAENKKPNHKILAVTSDIPFLTPEAVIDFVTRADLSKADLCYPIIPMSCCEAKFPEMKRTSLSVKEGEFTGGNMMLVNGKTVLANREKILQAYGARKKPLQLGKMLGPLLCFKIALAQILSGKILPIVSLETGVSQLLGCRAKAIISEYSEIGTDIDKPEDVRAAKARFLSKFYSNLSKPCSNVEPV